LTTGRLTAARTDVADAFEAIEVCFEQGWTDGLPVVPPTPGRVAECLDAAGLMPDEIIGRIETRENVEITAEKLAINAVMAGAKPAYMPVIVAAMRAMCDPMHNLHAVTATTTGCPHILIVNGPIRNILGINSQDAVFGPGWRANATIGRAVRLVIRNVLRSVPGEFDRASFAHPGRFSWCFGEDEESSPWPSIATDRGIPLGSSAVTAYALTWQFLLFSDEQNAQALLRQWGRYIREAMLPSWYLNSECKDTDESPFRAGRNFLIVTGSEHLRVMHEGGLDKETVRNELFRIFTEPHPTLRPLAIAASENILIASVRATGIPQSYFFHSFPFSNAITRQISL
jgi:hypothetical protein